jgi:hypothetical protein
VGQEVAPEDPAVVLTTWSLTASEQLHAGAQGPVLVLTGVLRDMVGNELLLADALRALFPRSRSTSLPPG